ncbi:uncharacterized protein ALTATR162_LOCUS5416 [Alternaria atra]|uniref:Uncharacterized protein n=1 Tax=Alternaria atra TaxID=119953 RepID=A0A8J2MZW1_9PLEO|nr:uncharacterized protein ALTATR162_LOCUS5416 [Alternaria atra]CAG5159107.1 unnamed protein product [Alternaria atra]
MFRGHSPLTFVENKESPVKLIEVTSDGHARRLEVTEDLIEGYIERDFATYGSRIEQPANVETIKLL